MQTGRMACECGDDHLQAKEGWLKQISLTTLRKETRAMTQITSMLSVNKGLSVRCVEGTRTSRKSLTLGVRNLAVLEHTGILCDIPDASKFSLIINSKHKAICGRKFLHRLPSSILNLHFLMDISLAYFLWRAEMPPSCTANVAS